MSILHQPLISVVTVSYNAVSTIEETICSVINQTYSNIEYIIIDGGSTDGTVDIIKKYADKIAYWVSEPDKGIFNAMNKGVLNATGEWVIFINCGDKFYTSHVLKEIFYHKYKDDGTDVLYGNMILKYSFADFLSYPKDLSCFNTIFPFSHPASIVRVSILKKYLFNEKYKLASDYDFFLKLYKAGYKFKYLNIIISVFEAENGASSVNKQQTYKEVACINGHYKKINFKIEYFIFILKNKILNLLACICPSYYQRLIKWRISKCSNIKLLQ